MEDRGFVLRGRASSTRRAAGDEKRASDWAGVPRPSADRAQPVNVPVAELGIELGVSSVIRRFRTDHRAAAVLEYALIAGLISILVVVGATTIGTKLSSHYYGPIAVGLS